MKKVFLMLFAMALAFCGCKDDSYESAKYVGTYAGTFNIVKQSDSSTSTKQGKLHFTQNPANKENLLWEYCIDMQNTYNSVFATTENSFTTEMIKTATSLININEYTDETIDKISAEATFDGSTVKMQIYYWATVFGVQAKVVIATFTGTKESK